MLSKIFIFALLPAASFAQVVGSATGFAKGVTGGGTATPVYPTTIAELKSYLTDSSARVIMLNKEFSFIGSEGTTTESGCRPSSNTCPNDGGQDAINGASWCTSGGYPTVSVTYDVAGTGYIDVKSNKSIVGVGSAGVIRGKGLRVANGETNVIIQNVHITELNPEYIWGGDAITLAGTDLIWIDHCKFSLIGRQMIVTGYDQAGRLTISNNEFDGQTSWSATCNGNHYWTMLFYGASDLVTFAGNYVHDCSGRAPKVGGATESNILFHAVNNYFYNMLGHSFDIGTGANVLIEGNVYDGVTTPITTASATAGGQIFNVPSSSYTSSCTATLGRACVVNSISNSGAFADYTNTKALTNFSGKNVQAATAASSVVSSVTSNAGIGKIGN
ncbi:polysaccharide lyase family 1 protein [Morchella snyderi]|nr:polysaccharide lyase family 1 protein [Morchella snyderi]